MGVLGCSWAKSIDVALAEIWVAHLCGKNDPDGPNIDSFEPGCIKESATH